MIDLYHIVERFHLTVGMPFLLKELWHFAKPLKSAMVKFQLLNRFNRTLKSWRKI